MKDKENKNINLNPKTNASKRRWFWRIFLGLVLVLIAGGMVLSSALNHQWGVRQIEQRLSNSFHTEVRLDTFHFSIWSGLSIDGLLMMDYRRDTMLYAGQIQVNYNNLIKTIFTRKLAFDKAFLRNTRIKLVTYPGEESNNWVKTLNQTTSFKTEIKNTKEEPSKKEPFFDMTFDIHYIQVEDFSLLHIHSNKHFENQYEIPWLEATILDDDFKEKTFHIGKVNIESPAVWLKKYPNVDSTLGRSSPMEETTTISYQTEDSTQIDEVGMASKKAAFLVVLDQLDLHSGELFYNNYSQQSPYDQMDGPFIDWNNIEINNIHLSGRRINFTNATSNGQIDHLSFEEKSGFTLNEMCVDAFSTSHDSISIEDCNIFTQKGKISGDFRMDYEGAESFQYFVDDVYLYGDISEAQIPLQDILYFAPALYKTHYFAAHSTKSLLFRGKILGPVNALKGRAISASIPGDLSFKGQISTRDLTHKGERFFSLKAKPLLTSTNTLVDILQIKQSISRFNRLGNIAFTGQFDGFIQDFVTFGTLESDLGIAEMDMRLNLRPGIKAAKYAGHMALQDFQLGKFLESKDLGSVTVNAAVTDGIGMTIQHAKANLDAHVLSLEYKGYQYQNGVFNGILNKSLVDGSFTISDDNIDLEFKGLIRDLDVKPKLNFTTKIKTLKLKPLHLNKENIQMQGDLRVNLEGTNIDNSSGSISLHHFKIQRDTDMYQLNTVEAFQKIYAGGIKTLKLESDLVDAQFNGNYKLSALHKDILNLFYRKHKQLYQSLKLPQYTSDTISRFYTYLIHAKNLDPILPILTRKDLKCTSFHANGIFDESLDSLEFSFNTPRFSLQNIAFNDLSIHGKEGEKEGFWEVRMDKVKKSNLKNYLTSVRASFGLLQDTLYSELEIGDSSRFIDTLHLLTISYPEEKGMVNYIQESSNISLGGEKWSIDPLNYIFVNKEQVDVRNFNAHSNKGKTLSIESYERTGITLELDKLPMSAIDSLIHIPNLEFTGEVNFYTNIKDIFHLKNISGGFSSVDLGLRPVQLGVTHMSFLMKDIKSPISIDLRSIKGSQILNASGHLRFDSLDVGSNEKKVGYVFKADGTNLPLKAIKIIIPNGISDIAGQVSSNVTLTGIGKKKDLRGMAYVEQGRAKIDYTGVTYYMDKQTVRFDKNYIDFTGVILSDTLGRKGVVTGGMSHEYLSDPSMNVTIQANKILGLSTTKYDNPSYYGTAIGEVLVAFKGPLKDLTIDIQGVAENGTNLFIPTGYSSEEGKYRNTFIYFKSKEKENKKKEENNAFQLTVNLDIEIKEEAEVSIIFDESAGDILKGAGTGKIHMSILPGGQISMIGDYEVVKGNYLFTLFNVVNKPFVVQPGGKVRWNGDPLNAQLDITAVYEHLQAPLAPLIADYLENGPDEIKTIAQRPHEVTLEMHITGALFHPEISFNIVIPNLTGPLRSYTIARLNDVNQNPAALNQQVFGLIVFNSFFPPSGIGQNAGSINYTASLNEFFSRQLSSLLTGVLQQVVSDVGFVSNVQLNVGYKQVQRYIGPISQAGGGEYNLETSLDLIDAVRLRYKGIYANSSITNESSYLDSEFDIEFIKTGVDGLRFKVIFAQDHFINNTPRSKVGIGASYKTDFDTLTWRNLIY